MKDMYIEVQFLKGLYGINLSNNSGLRDLVYDLKLNEFIDEEFEVESIYDLDELFKDRVIKMINSKGYKGLVCTNCNTPINIIIADYARIGGNFYCDKCFYD